MRISDVEKSCRNNPEEAMSNFTQHLRTYTIEEKQRASDNLAKRT